MDTLIEFGAPYFGFVVGMLVYARVARWIVTLLELTPKRRAAKGTAFNVGGLPARLFLHAGPWILAIVAGWAWVVLSHPHAPAWNWFFGAMLVSGPISVAVAYPWVRRVRRRALAAKQAKPPAQPTELNRP